MALSELAALEAAYQSLQPLDAAGRRRALHWLSDALDADAPLASALTAAAGAEITTPPATAKPEPRTRSRVSSAANGRAPRRRASAASAPASATPAPRRSRKARQSVAAEPAINVGRAYRRMPPANEVMAAYRKVGSVSGLAEHFDVPRHTVQGWARQLRRQGHSIGRTR
jgi:hypothetical protein